MKVFLNPEFDNSKLNLFGFLAKFDGIIFQRKTRRLHYRPKQHHHHACHYSTLTSATKSFSRNLNHFLQNPHFSKLRLESIWFLSNKWWHDLSTKNLIILLLLYTRNNNSNNIIIWFFKYIFLKTKRKTMMIFCENILS